MIEWSRALEATGRDVWVAISWAIDPAAAGTFAPAANSWRVGDDVDCYCETLVRWNAVARTFPLVAPWLSHSGTGRDLGRPDLDAINVGMGGLGGLGDVEQQTYVAFWALVGAPMYNDFDIISPLLFLLHYSPLAFANATALGTRRMLYIEPLDSRC